MTVPVKQTDVVQDFKDKIVSKIREEISSLLPDEAINQLVEKATKDIFFEPRKITEDGWSGRTKDAPSWFIEEVTKYARPLLEKEVKKYVEDNKEVFEKAMKEFFDQNNLMLMIISAISSATQMQMYNYTQQLSTDIVNKLKNGY